MAQREAAALSSVQKTALFSQVGAGAIQKQDRLHSREPRLQGFLQFSQNCHKGLGRHPRRLTTKQLQSGWRQCLEGSGNKLGHPAFTANQEMGQGCLNTRTASDHGHISERLPGCVFLHPHMSIGRVSLPAMGTHHTSCWTCRRAGNACLIHIDPNNVLVGEFVGQVGS